MNNTTLADWIGYGRNNPENSKARLVRRWVRAHRNHVPVIDRVNFPETGKEQRGLFRFS